MTVVKIIELSGAIRGAIEALPIPQEIEEAVTHFLAGAGDRNAYAVRSRCHRRRPAHGFFCRPAGYLFEYYW